ncbi:hypothetical protein BamMEX5DRAFT_3428 [Burkholderia ambifaria MEX-5]|uniref:Uncharacterized protein n=1 Tax=Burkholderia ambifaria MEX-5 TaxID=396597 RepID=B1T6L2_9BURK|nr:hypothetical protein BamMEX5DRAFT_3428 [Burkholderia ambifaria MEX-5]
MRSDLPRTSGQKILVSVKSKHSELYRPKLPVVLSGK